MFQSNIQVGSAKHAKGDGPAFTSRSRLEDPDSACRLSFSLRFHLLTRLTVAHLHDIDELSERYRRTTLRVLHRCLKYIGYSILSWGDPGEQMIISPLKPTIGHTDLASASSLL